MYQIYLTWHTTYHWTGAINFSRPTPTTSAQCFSCTCEHCLREIHYSSDLQMALDSNQYHSYILLRKRTLSVQIKMEMLHCRRIHWEELCKPMKFDNGWTMCVSTIPELRNQPCLSYLRCRSVMYSRTICLGWGSVPVLLWLPIPTSYNCLTLASLVSTWYPGLYSVSGLPWPPHCQRVSPWPPHCQRVSPWPPHCQRVSPWPPHCQWVLPWPPHCQWVLPWPPHCQWVLPWPPHCQCVLPWPPHCQCGTPPPQCPGLFSFNTGSFHRVISGQ